MEENQGKKEKTILQLRKNRDQEKNVLLDKREKVKCGRSWGKSFLHSRSDAIGEEGRPLVTCGRRAKKKGSVRANSGGRPKDIGGTPS